VLLRKKVKIIRETYKKSKKKKKGKKKKKTLFKKGKKWS
jgi:hypothetical protein